MSNELGFERPQGSRLQSYGRSGVNHKPEDLPGAFQTKANNSISLRHFDIRRSRTCGVSRAGRSRNTGPELALVGVARDLIKQLDERPCGPGSRRCNRRSKKPEPPKPIRWKQDRQQAVGLGAVGARPIHCHRECRGRIKGTE
jgi:hypothetical protein